MNGRKARALRRANGPKPAPTYPVFRTTPLFEVDGRHRKLIGHVAQTPFGRLLLTPSGGVSLPSRRRGTDVVVKVPSKAHQARVKASSRRAMRRARKKA